MRWYVSQATNLFLIRQKPYYNFIEVGYLNDKKIQEHDWGDAFSVREFMDYIRYDSNLEEIPYTDKMLHNLALEIVADNSNSVAIRFAHASYNELGEDYWHGYINIDPVLAQVILDTYN